MKPSGIVLAAVALVLVFAPSSWALSPSLLPGVGNVIKTFTLPGKLATADLFGDHFSCVASNVSDTDVIQVSLTLFDDTGSALSSFPQGEQSCSALGPHHSCGIVYIPYPLQIQAHCEIAVVTGNPATVRGILNSYGFSGDAISQTVTEAR